MSAVIDATALPAAVTTTLAAAPSAEYSGFIGWVLGLMETLGEVGVGAAVFIETFVPPIPSEAVLPGAGFLAYDGRMDLWWAIVAATAGAVLGAWIWWLLGAALGRTRTRALVARIPLLDADDFDRAERFFVRWGPVAVLVGRCVPLVRSFVSIPAGIERMPFWAFTLYTTVGSAVWNGLWIGLGYAFGPAIEPVLARWSGVLSNLVLAVIAALVLGFVVARVRRRRHDRRVTTSGSSARALHSSSDPS